MGDGGVLILVDSRFFRKRCANSLDPREIVRIDQGWLGRPEIWLAVDGAQFNALG